MSFMDPDLRDEWAREAQKRRDEEFKRDQAEREKLKGADPLTVARHEAEKAALRVAALREESFRAIHRHAVALGCTVDHADRLVAELRATTAGASP